MSPIYFALYKILPIFSHLFYLSDVGEYDELKKADTVILKKGERDKITFMDEKGRSSTSFTTKILQPTCPLFLNISIPGITWSNPVISTDMRWIRLTISKTRRNCNRQGVSDTDVTWEVWLTALRLPLLLVFGTNEINWGFGSWQWEAKTNTVNFLALKYSNIYYSSMKIFRSDGYISYHLMQYQHTASWLDTIAKQHFTWDRLQYHKSCYIYQGVGSIGTTTWTLASMFFSWILSFTWWTILTELLTSFSLARISKENPSAWPLVLFPTWEKKKIKSTKASPFTKSGHTDKKRRRTH